MLPSIRRSKEYVDALGVSIFRRWFDRQNAQARVKLSIALARVEQGNDGTIKSVGSGVCEIRVDWGPGYRVYFGFDGAALIILLAGGVKQRQDRDIAEAKALWLDYKRRKTKD